MEAPMTRSPWLIVGLAVLFGIPAYMVGRMDGKSAMASTVREQQRKEAVEGAVTWAVKKRLADQTSAKEAPARSAVARIAFVAGADSLAPRIAALEDTLRGKLSVTDTLLVYQEIAFNQKREIGKLREALSAAEKELAAWKQEAVRYKVMADEAVPIMQDLQTALDAEVKAHQCRVLFVKCPSRTASLAVGVLIGLATAVALH